MRLVLIDDRIDDYNNISKALTPDTDVIVFHYFTDTIESIKQQILTRYESVAIIQHKIESPTYKLLDCLDDAVLYNVETLDPQLQSWNAFSGFVLWLILENNVKYVDLLSCNLWADPNWRYVIETIRDTNNIHIRASIDITKNAGDFVLESDNVDTIGLYFTKQIVQYKYVFASINTTFLQLPAITPANLYRNIASNVTYTVIDTVQIAAQNGIYRLYVGSGLNAISTFIPTADTYTYFFENVRISSLGRSTFTIRDETNPQNKITVAIFDIGVLYENPTDLSFIEVPVQSIITVPENPQYYKLSIRGLTNAQNYLLFLKSTNSAGDSTGNTVFYSTGEVFPFSVPDPPIMNLLEPFSGAILVRFQPPLFNGGNAVTSYTYSIDYGNTFTQLTSFEILNSTFYIFNLTNGHPYTVYLNAFNARGKSASTISLPTIPFDVPTPPILNAVDPSFGSIIVRFADPSFNGGNAVTSYTYSLNNVNYFKLSAANMVDRSFTISGLTNANSYAVYLKAVNARGESAASVSSYITPNFTVPDAPTNTYAVLLDSAIRLGISDPSFNGGNTITGYAYSMNDGNTYTQLTSAEFANQSFTINGLLNGTAYRVYIVAINARGYSAPCITLPFKPYTTPLSPGISSIIPLAESMEVAFSPPIFDGGSPVQQYRYSIDAGNQYTELSAIDVSNLGFTITNLTNGVPYVVYLEAMNARGTSPPVVSAPVIPFGVPANPTIDHLDCLDGAIQIAFSPPGNNGGNAITTYAYSIDRETTYHVINAIETADRSFTVNGLTNGTSYILYFVAINARGQSLPSTLYPIVPFTTPDPPIFRSVEVLDSAIYVSFDDPVFNGGNAITTYAYSIDHQNTFVQLTLDESISRSFTIRGLQNSHSYVVYLEAFNARGNSQSAISNSVIPFAGPTPPIIETIVPTLDSIQVTFSPPIFNGGNSITSYAYSINEGISYIHLTPDDIRYQQFSVDGLNAGTQYTMYLKAFNARTGSLPAISYPVITLADLYQHTLATVTYTVPNRSGICSAIYGNTYHLYNGNTYLSTFVPTADTNPYVYVFERTILPTIGYTTFTIRDITAQHDVVNFERFIQPNNISSFLHPADFSNNKIRIPGLTNGTAYTILVKAYNMYGNSTYYSFSSTIPFTVPLSPIITTVVPLYGGARIDFADPSFNGGNTVSSYAYSTNGGNTFTTIRSVDISNHSFTVGQLINGNSYNVYLKAFNARGDSASAISPLFIPFREPDPPTGVSVTALNAAIHVHFSPPAFDGGNTITAYRYSYDYETTFYTVASSDRSFFISNLSNGKPYHIYIKAVNARGESVPYISSTIVPNKSVNTIYRNVSGTIRYVVGNAAIAATADTRYELYTSTLDGNTTVLSSFVPTANTFEYVFGNVAVSQVGYTTFDIKQIQYTNTDSGSGPIPIATTILSFTEFVWYNNPYTELTFFPSSALSLTTNTIDMVGLTDGQKYIVFIKSTNAKGESVYYSFADSVPFREPDPPTDVSITALNAAIQVNFSSPAFDGGNTITSYRYSYDYGTTFYTVASSDRSFFIPNLFNGRPYHIYINAVNARGESVPYISSTIVPNKSVNTIYRNVSGTIRYVVGNAVIAATADTRYELYTSTPDGNAIVLSSFVPTANTFEYVFGNVTVSQVGYTTFDIKEIQYTNTDSGPIPIATTILSFTEFVWYNNPYTELTFYPSSALSLNTNTIDVVGLTDGQKYIVFIKSTNAKGESVYYSFADFVPFREPDPPTDVSITALNTAIQVNFSPPAFDGGNTITAYRYSYDYGTTFSTVDASARSFFIPNLFNGRPYHIYINAVNARGESVPYISSTIVPNKSVNTIYRNVSGTIRYVVGNAVIAATADTRYELYTSTPGGNTTVLSSFVPTVNTFEYVFGNVTVSQVGYTTFDIKEIQYTNTDSGSDSGPIPIATTILSFTEFVWYNNPYTELTFYPSSALSLNTNTIDVVGLTDGQRYIVFIKSTNAKGESVYYSFADFVPFREPDPPTDVSIIALNAAIQVNFSPPAFDGGNTITAYRYSYDYGTTFSTVDASDRSFFIPNLSNGKPYHIYINAVNARGESVPYISSTIVPNKPKNTIYQNVAGTIRYMVPNRRQSTGGNELPDPLPIISYALYVSESNTPLSIFNSTADPLEYIFGNVIVPQMGYISFDIKDITTPHPTSFYPPILYSFTEFVLYNYDQNLTFQPSSGLSLNTHIIDVSGVTNGQKYAVFLKTTNLLGDSLYYSFADTIPFREPDAPRFVTLVPLVNSIQVLFAAPLFDGGNTITSYVYSMDGGNTYTPISETDISNSSFTVYDLTNGQPYVVYLKAQNSRDYSIPAVSLPVIPFTTPDAPRFQSFVPYVGSILVDYNDPSFNGGNTITSYAYSIDGENTYTPVNYDDFRYKQFAIDGLTGGTAYIIYLKAFNARGSSAPAITYPVVTLTELYRNQPATVTYTANQNNGDLPAIIGHTYHLYIGNTILSTFTTTVNASPFTYVFANVYVSTLGKNTFTIRDDTSPESPSVISTFDRFVYSDIEANSQLSFVPATDFSNNKIRISGRTNGTSYIVLVKAYNINGNSFHYSFSSTIPFTVPDPPAFTTITPLIGSIRVEFADPVFNGGNTITRYDYSVDGGNSHSYTPLSTREFANRDFVINGLTNGNAYTIYLKGYNARGNSFPGISVPVIPFTIPNPPMVDRIIGFDRSAKVWFTDTFDGGNAVTSYEYSADFGTTFYNATILNGNSCIVPNLINDQPYYIYLRAKNARGYSLPYITTTVVTPQKALNVVDRIYQNRTTTVHYILNDNVPYYFDKRAKYGNTYALHIGDTRLSTFTPMNDTFEYVFGNVTVPIFGNVTFGITDITIENESSPNNTFFFTEMVLYEYENDLSFVSVPVPENNTNTIHIPGLTDGQQYVIFIKSSNIQGDAEYYSFTTGKPYRLPDPPIIQELIPNDASIDVVFLPAFDGGNPIVSYSYAYTISTDPSMNGIDGNQLTYTTFDQRDDGIYRIRNLTNGVNYTIYVKANNLRGNSVASNSKTTLPFSVPFPPTIYQLKPTDTTIAIYYQEPNNGGNTITDYLYSVNTEATPDPIYVSMNRHPAISTPFMIEGLPNFTEYTIRIKAVNARGNSYASIPAVVKTSFVPDPPIIYELIPQIGAIDISFSVPANGGNPILDYLYSINDSSYVSMIRPLPTNDLFRILDLSNGIPYTVSIQAVNIAGNSLSSNRVTTVPFDVPEPPIIVSVDPSNQSGVVLYNPPQWNGGNTITGYKYALNSGPFVDVDIAGNVSPWQFIIYNYNTPTTIEPLLNGTEYSLSLIATNARGNSAVSLTARFTPRTIPDAPSDVFIYEENASVSASFTTAYDGGNTIVGYTYSLDGVFSSQLYSNPQFTITGLENGHTYMLGLHAKNYAGYSGFYREVTPYTIPDQPVVTSIIPADSKITIIFVGFNGGRNMATTYTINDGNIAIIYPEDLIYNSTNHTYEFNIVGLQNGTTYSIRIRTINPAGYSPISIPYSITPYTVSKPPVIRHIEPGVKKLSVFFTPDTDNGGNTVTKYEYVAYDEYWSSSVMKSGYVSADTLPVDDPNFEIPNLTYGINYNVRIRAVNYAGNSAFSNDVSGSTVDVPETPILDNIVPADQTLTVFFTKGSPRGKDAEICKYYIYDSTNNVLDEREFPTDINTANVSFTLTDISGAPLENGIRYGVDIQNRNSIGYSELSNRLFAIPCKPPLPPLFLTNQGINGTAIITFIPNPDNGGAELTDILLSFNGPLRSIHQQSIGLTINTLRFDGLRNKNDYILQLYAVNPAGISAPAEITVITYLDTTSLDYVQQNSTLNPNGSLPAAFRYAGVVGRSRGNAQYL